MKEWRHCRKCDRNARHGAGCVDVRMSRELARSGIAIALSGTMRTVIIGGPHKAIHHRRDQVVRAARKRARPATAGLATHQRGRERGRTHRGFADRVRTRVCSELPIVDEEIDESVFWLEVANAVEPNATKPCQRPTGSPGTARQIFAKARLTMRHRSPSSRRRRPDFPYSVIAPLPHFQLLLAPLPHSHCPIAPLPHCPITPFPNPPNPSPLTPVQ